jgi:hypothetical protein
LVTDSNGNESTSATGSFDDILITDDVNYKITAKVTHSEGNVPLTNLGNEAPDYKIKAGELDLISTNSVKGYRKSFYGTLNHKDEYDIRDLPKSSDKALSNGSKFTINIPAGALRTVIAYPATLKNMSEVFDKNDSNSNIVSSFLEPEII